MDATHIANANANEMEGKKQNKKHLRNPILATVDSRICGTTTVKATVNV
jgi:hypothetical protein